MEERSRVVYETALPRIFRDETDGPIKLPEDWDFLPAGDPGITRRLKALGPCWKLVFRFKNRLQSKGLFAPKANIEEARRQIEAERENPAYEKKLNTARQKRAQKQAEYVEDFEAAVLQYLNFHPKYEDLARKLASAVTKHATPVGSGTVARTERIPLNERVKAAVIAWMRHQTSDYDQLQIEHVKGRRREVRRDIAQISHQILTAYRKGEPRPEDCPLRLALKETPKG